MLTANTAGHLLYERMHKHDKRMVLILDAKDYDPWLRAPDEAKTFFKQWTRPLEAHANPLPPEETIQGVVEIPRVSDL